MKIRLLCALLLASFIVACTDYSDPPPDFGKYQSDGKLMLNICNKLANEPDATTLRKAAVATEMSRVVSCADYNGECRIYGSCLALAIRLSKDGVISAEERQEMRAKVTELNQAFTEGLKKLKEK